MNIQQLEYITAVEKTGSFSKAAEHCLVTQPTLSMMVHRLEEELGLLVFNRNHSPMLPTEQGKEILRYARRILKELKLMKEFADSTVNDFTGELKIGVLPTIASYLIPLFTDSLAVVCPGLHLKIFEVTAETIIGQVTTGELDLGIASSPMKRPGLKETLLYKEEFMVYANSSEKILEKKSVYPEDIDSKLLWLLEEGHCMNSQVADLCKLKNRGTKHGNISYETGSIESLIRMTDIQGGITIIPELAAVALNEKQKLRLRKFKLPAPVREICLLHTKHYPRRKLIKSLSQVITESVKGVLANRDKQFTLDVDI